jgi:DeoR family suf operon transcriptional repressor
MANSSLDLLSYTKRLLLVGVKRRGAALAEELAGDAFLSAGAARQHLRALELQGYLTHNVDRTGTGRPRYLFSLTPMGDSLFPQASGDLAGLLVTTLEEEPPGVREEFLARAMKIAFRPLPANFADAPREEKLQTLVTVLDRMGYLPETEQTADGQVRLTLGHCPLMDLAAAHPLVCDFEQSFIAQFIAPDELRVLEWRREGGTLCRYAISPASPDSAHNR